MQNNIVLSNIGNESLDKEKSTQLVIPLATHEDHLADQFKTIRNQYRAFMESFSDRCVLSARCYVNDGIGQLTLRTQSFLVDSLTLSANDKFECDKIGGICGVAAAFMTASLKRSSFRATKMFAPVVAGWGVYKLVATNPEVKKSLCDGMIVVRDQIK